MVLPKKQQSEISRRGHWKRGICIKLSEIDFQVCDKFVTILRTLPLMYETNADDFAQFGALFATNLRNALLANAPFSGFLKQKITRNILGNDLASA